MKINIYKPCKTIFWNDIAKDTNVWSREIVGLSKLLADRGHEVVLTSSTDYNGNYNNVSRGQIYDKCDVFVVFNGAFSKQEIKENKVLEAANCEKKVLIASDLDLTKTEHELDEYDYVLTATKKQICKNSEYGAVEHYHMYKQEMYKGGWEVRQHRGVFIGHDRHKVEKMLDYVIRPDIDFYGKMESLNINKIIDRQTAYNILKTRTYSPVFFDKRVEDLDFVTARPLELMLFGVVPFIDIRYDMGELQFKLSDHRRVRNYQEMYEKAQNMGKDEFLYLQKKGFAQLSEIMTGDLAYQLFMGYVW